MGGEDCAYIADKAADKDYYYCNVDPNHEIFVSSAMRKLGLLHLF